MVWGISFLILMVEHIFLIRYEKLVVLGFKFFLLILHLRDQLALGPLWELLAQVWCQEAPEANHVFWA